MYHGRIKRLGAPVDSMSGVFGSVHTPCTSLDDLWTYVTVWMQRHVPYWAIPSCPRNLMDIDLLKHIGPDTEGYSCKVDSCAVFGFKFIGDRLMHKPTQMVLEIWDDERDLALPVKFWEDFDVKI